MSTGRWNFKRTDIIRVTNAIEATGLRVRCVEIGRDMIRFVIGEPEKARESPATDNEWDEVFIENNSDGKG